MRQKDYLHSDYKVSHKNDLVFQRTYQLIERFAEKTTKIESAAFSIKDEDSIRALDKINELFYSEEIIDLVNYTIENFVKNGKQ